MFAVCWLGPQDGGRWTMVDGPSNPLPRRADPTRKNAIAGALKPAAHLARSGRREGRPSVAASRPSLHRALHLA